MSVTISTTNKPLNPRAQDLSPKGYNRASLYSGKALDFDGVNDSVTLPNLPMQSSNNWAIVMNINITQSASTKYIFDGREAGADGFALYILDNTTRLNYYSNGTDNLTTYNFPASEWFNLAIVRDGANVHFYNNGVFVETITHSTTYDVTGNFYIGQRFSGIQFLDGQIAGVKSFSTALTAAQVSDLYLNPEKIVPDGVANSALKLWLPMMEGAGTTAYDGSGNGNDGTISGATWVSGVGAPVAQTALVGWNKGTNLLTYSEEFSTAAGFFANTVGASTATYTANFGASPNGTTTADRIELALNGEAYADWVRVFGVSTGVTYTYSIYLKSLSGTPTIQFINDGTANISKTLTTSWARYDFTWTASSATIYPRFLLGSGTSTSADLLAWGAQLTATSDVQPYVETFATAQTSPVLLPQGLTASKDITGVNSVSRNAYALNLDGASWAEVHDNASLDMTTTATMEVWINADKLEATSQHIFVKSSQSYWTGNYGRYVLRATDSNINWWFDDFTTNTKYYNVVLSGWNHLVVTKDGAAEKLYLNGALVDTETGAATFTASTFPLLIGTRTGYDEFFNSDISLPRIYNRALTATEVSRNYNADKSKFGL